MGRRERGGGKKREGEGGNEPRKEEWEEGREGKGEKGEMERRKGREDMSPRKKN